MIFKFYLMPTQRCTRCQHVILWLFKIWHGIGVSNTCRASVLQVSVSNTCTTRTRHSLWSACTS